MIIDQISQSEKERLQKKFDAFDKILENKQEALGYMKHDPSLFAYFFFKNDKGGRFKVLPWQDKFLNSKSKRKLLSCSRQIGKSTTSGIDALHKSFFNPGFTILVISRTKGQATEFVYRMRRFLNTSRFTIWSHISPKKKENKHEIILKSVDKKVESRIIVVPATDAALGYTANLVIGDEAARWEDGDRVYREDIDPIVDWTDGDIYLLSTPRGKQGFFYEFYNMPEVWEIYNFDYTVNPKNTPKKMDEKRKIHTPISFAMNYLAKFVSSESAYFTPKEIENAKNEEAGLGWKGEGNIAIGVDFGKVNDKSVIYIGTILNPTKPRNEQIIKVLDRRVKSLGTDYSIILSELKSIHKLMKPQIFVLDVTSGEVPSDILRQEGLRVEPFKFTIQSKIDIMNNLKVLMQQKRLHIPIERDLIAELEVFEYKISEINQDRIRLHAAQGFHDDEVDALALMTYGLTKGIGFVDSSFVSSVASPQDKGNTPYDEILKKSIKANTEVANKINRMVNPT